MMDDTRIPAPGRPVTHPTASRRTALFIAGALLLAAAALRMASPQLITAAQASRALGMLVGAVVIVYANAVPKVLARLSPPHAAAAEQQAVRRFTGFALVIGGLAYIVAWAVAPIAQANLIAGLSLAATVAAVIGRVAFAAPHRSQP